LLKLGIEIGQTSVAKYMVRRRHPPSQGWRTFIRNHADGIAAMICLSCRQSRFACSMDCRSWGTAGDIFCGLASQRIQLQNGSQIRSRMHAGGNRLFCYLIRDRDGAYGEVFIRRLRSIGIRDRPTSPLSPWQNAYAERLIGSIRRECLDHVVVLGERHLRHVLLLYMNYYNETRTHLSLNKDSPLSRTVERAGGILCRPILGGLHHKYGASGKA
jgi:Integrase core domain